MFDKELKTLMMEPHMWKTLNELLPADGYRKVVLDYQHREFEKLPECKTLFGVCRYWSSGRCANKGHCRCKR